MLDNDLLMVVAGEASADGHAAELARELRELRPSAEIFGVGGKALAAEGAELLFDFSDTGVVGLTEVIPELGRFYRAYKSLIQAVEKRKPRGVLLLDLPDFNLMLAKKIRQASPETRIIYYISPQVWAWRRGRVKKIAERIDTMLVLFPFEEELYRKAGMDVEFTGHPLRDRARASAPKAELREEFGLAGAGKVVAVMPGSRKAEVGRYMPAIRPALVELSREFPETAFIMALAPTLRQDFVEGNLGEARSLVKVVEARSFDVLAAADLAITASGTVTLEAALTGTPMVVLGAVSWPTYLMARPFVRAPHISLPNVIAGREIVPELVQFKMRAGPLREKCSGLLANPEKLANIRKELEKVREALGDGGASARAARAVHRRLWG